MELTSDLGTMGPGFSRNYLKTKFTFMVITPNIPPNFVASDYRRGGFI
jgi:hypothetical protein